MRTETAQEMRKCVSSLAGPMPAILPGGSSGYLDEALCTPSGRDRGACLGPMRPDPLEPEAGEARRHHPMWGWTPCARTGVTALLPTAPEGRGGTSTAESFPHGHTSSGRCAAPGRPQPQEVSGGRRGPKPLGHPARPADPQLPPLPSSLRTLFIPYFPRWPASGPSERTSEMRKLRHAEGQDFPRASQAASAPAQQG